MSPATHEAGMNPLRQAWADGHCPVGSWVLSDDALIAEATAAAGFDWICLDTQHGWIALDELPHLIQVVALAGAVPIVRVSANEPWLIGRALDAGAYGVMVPMVSSVAEAQQAVASCRYQPVGRRSVGAYRPAHSIASTPRRADTEVICIIQIESSGAIQDLSDICKTPGLDVVYIGPGDLALSLGLSSKSELPESVLFDVRDTALANGVIPAMHGESGEEAGWAIDNGFRLTCAGADVDFVYNAAASALDIANTHRQASTQRRLSGTDVPRLAVGPGPEPTVH